jgi:hypothetical protein
LAIAAIRRFYAARFVKEKEEQASAARPLVATDSTTGIRTMAIDIGGSGVKAMLLDEAGKPLTERLRAKRRIRPRPRRSFRSSPISAAAGRV